jgi:hypothetical protein
LDGERGCGGLVLHGLLRSAEVRDRIARDGHVSTRGGNRSPCLCIVTVAVTAVDKV